MLSIRREYNLDAIASAGSSSPLDTIQLANQNAMLQSVTVDNYSNSTVAVFFDRTPTSTGSPSTIVPSQFLKTIPCVARAIGISIRAPKGDILRGTVYLEATTDKLAAAGGPTPNSTFGTGTWDYVNWDSGATYGA